MPFACTETWWEGEISLGKIAIFLLKLTEQSCATEIKWGTWLANEAFDRFFKDAISRF